MALAVFFLGLPAVEADDPELDLPWRDAGLSERQAAAHLLDRLSFGARPGDVDRLLAIGLSRWVDQQLEGDLPDRRVDVWLAQGKSLELSAREIAETYPRPGRVRRMAIRQGVIDEPSEDADAAASGEQGMKREDRRAVRQWARKKGLRPVRDAMFELVTQKLARAIYSENQLTEVLTDFWFNHFNVSVTDNQARVYVWPYERDAIRPHVTGSFRAMLEATAKHPAMLAYLDNARSTADPGVETALDMWLATKDRVLATKNRVRAANRGDNRARRDRAERRRNRRTGDGERPQRSRGLNENYARELMELHTLGVDGGYDQEDVIEVARAFTGWSTYPPDRSRRDVSRRIQRAKRFPGAGFVFEQSFIFRADAHDAGPKTVLGHQLPAGRGMEDGFQVLDLLAAHPSTARHLSRKFAARFVCDEPPESLVDRLAATFERSQGDLGQMVVTLVESPEFWAANARQAKIKSPFEVVVSALRIIDAEVTEPRGVYDWIRRMGQPLYAYQAPTGYPDRASAWVNTGALLSRMNFGLQVATGQVPGVRLDLPALASHREPGSLDEALELYLPLLLPERDVSAASTRLRGVIHDPELVQKIADSAPPPDEGGDRVGADDDWDVMAAPGQGRRRDRRRSPAPVVIDSSPVAQAVGVILGSPEFQRR